MQEYPHGTPQIVKDLLNCAFLISDIFTYIHCDVCDDDPSGDAVCNACDGLGGTCDDRTRGDSRFIIMDLLASIAHDSITNQNYATGMACIDAMDLYRGSVWGSIAQEVMSDKSPDRILFMRLVSDFSEAIEDTSNGDEASELVRGALIRALSDIKKKTGGQSLLFRRVTKPDSGGVN